MITVARIYNDFNSKFGIPRQSGILHTMESRIVFEKEYSDANAVRGLEDFSHIWLLWGFSENKSTGWSPTVRPPRLGGNTRVGVFATRSPFRPNNIGLSSVEITRIDFEKSGPVIYVKGADLMNGTPIYDIKPYIPYSDSHPEARGGFAEEVRDYELQVDIPEAIVSKIPGDKYDSLVRILSQDPRPSYHKDQNRIYGFEFGNMHIEFNVTENVLKVLKCDKIQN